VELNITDYTIQLYIFMLLFHEHRFLEPENLKTKYEKITDIAVFVIFCIRVGRTVFTFAVPRAVCTYCLINYNQNIRYWFYNETEMRYAN
jgi:hypothetical protein